MSLGVLIGSQAVREDQRPAIAWGGGVGNLLRARHLLPLDVPPLPNLPRLAIGTCLAFALSAMGKPGYRLVLDEGDLHSNHPRGTIRFMQNATHVLARRGR